MQRGWRLCGWIVALGLYCLPCHARTPQVAGIAHVAFRATDLAKSRSFFQKLGFEEAFVLTDGSRVTEVFEKINDRQFIELYPIAGAAQPSGWMHVCYESNVLKPLNLLYRARGLDPSAVVKAGAGNLLFSLKGPDGRTIEFTQYLPGSRHFNDRGKHLGVRRISRELWGIQMAPDQLSAATAFYTRGLGFEKKPQESGVRLSISSHTNQFVDLDTIGGGDDPQFVFRVGNVTRTAQRLKDRGLTVEQRNRSALVKDPDGNVFVFKGAPSH